MKRTIFLAIVAGMVILAHAQNWSFGGGTIYFDNAPTQWNETKMMLVIGNECWSEIYEMQPSEQANRWSVALPNHWNGPSYMAVINGADLWSAGTWGTVDEDQPTNINQTPFPSGEGRGEASKMLKEGQVLIQHNNQLFTVQGQPLQ